MANLRIVGGTEYAAPGNEDRLTAARERILGTVLPVAAMSVQAALLWMRANMANEAESDRWGHLMVELARCGIALLPPHESSTVLGVLEDPQGLYKSVPALAEYQDVLSPGTDLYRRAR